MTPGRNPKLRPGVIVTPNNELNQCHHIVLAAITTRFDLPLPATKIQLPWSRAGDSRTGLRKSSVVVANWLVTITPSDVDEIAGVVPSNILIELLNQLQNDVS